MTDTRISVIIPAYNAEGELRQCLTALRAGRVQPEELLVADDGSRDGTAAVAREFGAVVIATNGPLGPARARNLAAQQARGSMLVFFDADVLPHPDTLERISGVLESTPDLAAVIGAYDDDPACSQFLSQYKNLQHCFVHRQALRDASTFWTGCGAVRREVFLAHGGFSESYARPSIEDIEFGVRVIRTGGRIALDPAIQVKHLKRWTFRGLLRTDIFQRAVPWTQLIAREGRLPNDLNLSGGQRISAAAALLALAAAAAGTWIAGPRFPAALFALVWLMLGPFWTEGGKRLAAAFGLLGLIAVLWWFGEPLDQRALAPAAVFLALASCVLALNWNFVRFLARRRGPVFAIAAVPFFFLYLVYSSVTFAVVMAREKLRR